MTGNWRESWAFFVCSLYWQKRISFRSARKAFKYLVSRGYQLSDIKRVYLAKRQPAPQGQEDDRG